MKNAMTVLGAVAAVMGAGYIVGTIENRERAAFQIPDAPAGFEQPAARTEPEGEPAQEESGLTMPLRDSVASVPALAAPAAFLPSGRMPAAAPGAGSKAAAAQWVTSRSQFQSLMAAPVRFMVDKTLLGKPSGFAAFLKDPKRTAAYAAHPLIKGALDNPMVMKVLLNNPAVVQGFLSSPAMQDPGTIRLLAQSRLFDTLVQSPGVRAVLSDPVFMQKTLFGAQTMAWMAKHPEALGALTKLKSQG